MALRKTAITMPASVLEKVDEIARERGESRSAFITAVVRMALRARQDREITRKLENLFADDSTQTEQCRGAEQLDALGTDWTDERW